MKIMLAGEESVAARAFQAIERSDHELVAVLTSQSDGDPSSLLLRQARSAAVNTWPAQMLANPDFATTVRDLGVEVLLNVHSLHVVRPEVLEVLGLGGFNLHPGPLPQYAGLNAPSWAIYNGETEHGVTLHEMTPTIDAGRIAYQEAFPIGEHDTGLSLSIRCAEIGLVLLEKLLAVLEHSGAGGIDLRHQDLSERTYYNRTVPNDGCLQWKSAALDVHNFVRACDYHPFPSPWGTPRCRYGKKIVEVLKTSLTGDRCGASSGLVEAGGARSALVACGDEWLSVDRIRLDGHTVDGSELPIGARLQ